MTSGKIAERLVALCREGKFVDAIEELYSQDVVSVEAMDYRGTGREMAGKEAVIRKNQEWFLDKVVTRVEVMGPYLSPERIAVRYEFDWTVKETGEVVKFDEVAVYSVADGRIVREEFLYGAMG
jgi:ketosteroid isomerase-like protein